MSDKDLIWVPKEIAEKHKNALSDEEQAKIVLTYIEEKKLDFSRELDLLDESALRFKAVCITHKNELAKIYNEQGDMLYKMWEDMGDVGSKINEHAKQLADEIRPISQEVNNLKRDVEDLKKLLSSFHIYDAEKLAGLVSMVNSMSDGTKDIMKFLLNEYKRSES